MKKSIDLIHQSRFKKIILTNDLNDIKESENKNYTSLSGVYTSKNSNNKKIIPNYSYSPNSSARTEPNAKKKEINSEKNGRNSDQRLIDMNLKNTWVKKTKTNLKNVNRKIVYIKKRKDETANKKENPNNKTDIHINSKTLDNDKEQKAIIKEIKDSVICYICLMKITSPRICPNCHKIACEKCLKNWFIDKGNNNCGYCRAVLTFDKMISIPIINNVANLIDKISSKKSTKKLGMSYHKSKKASEINYSKLSDMSNEKNVENFNDILNNDNIIRNSINIDNFSKLKNDKNEIYLDKQKSLISRSTHGPYINMIGNAYEGYKKEDYCQRHPDQPLYYYCLECNQAYCRTCFVFFGDEKDKHNNHNIIEYEKYRTIDVKKVAKLSNKLDDKYEELEAYIKRCEALKQSFEFERVIVQNHIKKLMDSFNKKMDENIKVLDNIIKNYKFYLNQIEKGQKDVQKLYAKISSFKSSQNEDDIIEKLSNICKIKYYNSKEVDGFSDMQKNIGLNFYETKLKKFEIKQNNFHFKVSMEDSKYQLSIIQKDNEVQIYIYWPVGEEKNVKVIEKEKNGLLPFIFMRRKNKNWEFYKLDEFLTYKGNNYFIKRFSSNDFCNINSYFKIKGFLYETYIE